MEETITLQPCGKIKILVTSYNILT